MILSPSWDLVTRRSGATQQNETIIWRNFRRAFTTTFDGISGIVSHLTFWEEHCVWVWAELVVFHVGCLTFVRRANSKRSQSTFSVSKQNERFICRSYRLNWFFFVWIHQQQACYPNSRSNHSTHTRPFWIPAVTPVALFFTTHISVRSIISLEYNFALDGLLRTKGPIHLGDKCLKKTAHFSLSDLS